MYDGTPQRHTNGTENRSMLDYGGFHSELFSREDSLPVELLLRVKPPFRFQTKFLVQPSYPSYEPKCDRFLNLFHPSQFEIRSFNSFHPLLLILILINGLFIYTLVII